RCAPTIVCITSLAGPPVFVLFSHLFFFFFNDPPPTQIYTLSLHDALPISVAHRCHGGHPGGAQPAGRSGGGGVPGRHPDQRADPELPAASDGDAHHPDVGRPLAGAPVAGIHRDAGAQHSLRDRLMLELTDAQIGGWVSAFLLPLFRIGALLMVMPVFGGNLVPVRVRLYLALAITLLLSPTLAPMPEVDALSLRMMLL